MAENEAKTIKQVLCPTCGRGTGMYHQQKVKIKGYKVPAEGSEPIPFLDYLAQKYDLDKPYFAVEQETGDCGFGRVTELKPDEWPEGYESMKAAILRGLAWWKRQGWITLKEIINTLAQE